MRILSRNVFFNTITLIQPSVVLERGAAGVWNFAQLGGQAPPDSAVEGGTGRLDWLLELGILEIVDGRLSLVDSLALADPDPVA